MNALKSYKSSRGPAGRLMTAGGQEKPAPEALHRVARQLGVSGEALAAASIAHSAGALADPTAGAGVGGAVKTASSVLVASIVKGSVIGLCLSGMAYVGLHTFGAESKPLQASSPKAASIPLEPGSHSSLSSAPLAASITSETLTEAIAEPAPVRSALPPVSTASVTAASALPPAVAPAVMASNARFEDESLPPPAVETTWRAGSTQALNSHLPAVSTSPADVRLAREVTSLDRVRTFAKQGNAPAALRELDAFDRIAGYTALRSESQLVRIDVLLSLSRRDEAAAVARQLLAAGAPATQRSQLEALAGVNRPAGK